jgi:hypothetical protein
VDPHAVSAAIHLGAEYLVRACGPDGRFVYRINLDPRVEPKRKYNILRHAGAMIALAEYHAWHPRDAVRDAVIRAGRFLWSHGVAPLRGRPDLLAVWSRPEIDGTAKTAQAKLGATGLGLLALVELERMRPGVTPIDDLRRLGRFLLFMQRDDGGVYSKLRPAPFGGYLDPWTSLYYPGEAALGLLSLHDLDPAPDWLHAAVRIIEHLARARAGREVVEADHWALAATARLLSHGAAGGSCGDADLLRRHAEQICRSILAEQQVADANPTLAGGFTEDGRTTPAATRLEGLLAALTFLPREPLADQMSVAVERGIDFLLRAQVESGPCAGAMPRAIAQLSADHPLSNDTFNRRATEVRIDYVQHALSAMLRFVRCAAPDGPGS